MPSAYFEEFLCAGTPTTPTVTGCDDADRASWRVVTRPVGAQVTFSDDTIPAPTITVTEDGLYRFEVLCYFIDGNSSAVGTPAETSISCPRGVIAGQSGTVQLIGCDDGVLSNVLFGGVATGVTFDINGTGTVTTDANTSGAASVGVDCTIYLADGTETTERFFCVFQVIPRETELKCTLSPAVEINYLQCGEACESDFVDVVFNCDEDPCEVVSFGLVFKECPECPEDPACKVLKSVPLTGANKSVVQPIDVYDCGCFEEEIYNKDQPVFFWNNICACADWTINAPAIEGTSIYNACGCDAGQKWCFSGSATITASGPARFIDTMVIWGHNITDGMVTTSPISTASNDTGIGVTTDSSCMEGYTTPVILNFVNPNLPDFPELPDPRENVTNFSATITSNDGGRVCIEHIFIGSKFFLPEDLLPESYQNVFDGTDYELEVTDSECGPLSRTLKHVPISMSLEIDCLSPKWVEERWRPFIRYSQKNGILFQWSRNNFPNDIFYGWLNGPVGPSTWSVDSQIGVVLEAEGWITQPQPKKFE